MMQPEVYGIHNPGLHLLRPTSTCFFPRNFPLTITDSETFYTYHTSLFSFLLCQAHPPHPPLPILKLPSHGGPSLIIEFY